MYLASLNLGASAVQTLARQAKVARATTYIIIQSLVERGLMTRYADSDRTMYVSEPPTQLLRMLEKQEEVIHEQREQVESILPGLHAVMNITDGRPLVRYYAGVQGLRTIRQEMVQYCGRGDTWYSFTPVDYLLQVFSKEELAYADQRKAKGIVSHIIFTTESLGLKKELLMTTYKDMAKRKFIPPRFYPSTSGLTVFRDRIAIGSYEGGIGGVILESKSIAAMMESIFKLTWTSIDTI